MLPRRKALPESIAVTAAASALTPDTTWVEPSVLAQMKLVGQPTKEGFLAATAATRAARANAVFIVADGVGASEVVVAVSVESECGERKWFGTERMVVEMRMGGEVQRGTLGEFMYMLFRFQGKHTLLGIYLQMLDHNTKDR